MRLHWTGDDIETHWIVSITTMSEDVCVLDCLLKASVPNSKIYEMLPRPLTCFFCVNDNFNLMFRDKALTFFCRKWLLPGLASPQENQMMNIKNFHGAVQSNNAIFADFKHMKIWRVFFLLICLFKWQQIYLGLMFKRNL